MMYDDYSSVSERRESRVSLAQMALFRQVYVWMTFALVITGLTAFVTAHSSLQSIVEKNYIIFLIVWIGVALLFTTMLRKLSMVGATLLFITYSLLTGLALSSIFGIYNNDSIAATFFVTAGTFAVMAVIGYVTKKDLSSMGGILMMALIGLIIATVVNYFWVNSYLYKVITYVGVLIFVGLTAYDAQQIKRALLQPGVEVNEETRKFALLGAFTLYLDFINLFLMLLRIFGSSRD